MKYDRGLAAGSERKKTNRASGTLRIRVSNAMFTCMITCWRHRMDKCWRHKFSNRGACGAN